MADDISLAELIKQSMRTVGDGLSVACPARVLSYDAAKAVCDVQPMIKRRHEDPDTGEVFYESFAPIANVRVSWPYGGGFGMTMPLEKGDFVDLVFQDQSDGEFRATGQESEPLDGERHGMSYPVAHPGCRHNGNPFPASSASKAVFGHGTGARAEISSTIFDIGPNGAFLAHAAETAVSIAALQTEIAGIAGIMATVVGITGAMTPGPADKAADIKTTFASFGGAAALVTTATGVISGQAATLPTTVLKGK